MRDQDLKAFSEEVKKGFVEVLGDKSSFKRKKVMEKLYVYNSSGAAEFVSADEVGVKGLPEREWDKIKLDKADYGIINQFAVYEDVIRVKVEKGFNGDEVLAEVERIDEKYWG